MLDVGTDNPELLQDSLYTGLLQRRLRGPEYAELLEEFVTAVQEVFPGALIQFEDFATDNAIGLLARYRDRMCAFNDDVQGTAAAALAALLVSGRLTGRKVADQRLLFVGAGAAATGIADLLTAALRRVGLTEIEARQRSWMFDAGGLLVASRPALAAFQRGYAHQHVPVATLRQAILTLRPTALIGVSGQPHLFTEPVLQAMAQVNERPVVFALSNPTSRAECTAEQAYHWTGGRAVFSSGSPSGPVELKGRRLVPSQANNAYIFPGLSLGVVAAGARRVTDAMLLAAAGALAAQAEEDLLREGTLFPPLRQIRAVTVRIAAAVARVAVAEGVAIHDLPQDLEAYLDRCMYQPVYRSYLV
jgi:malate dehydrogenase (oxaloacetate-decarboxylating)(NADP+)